MLNPKATYTLLNILEAGGVLRIEDPVLGTLNVTKDSLDKITVRLPGKKGPLPVEVKEGVLAMMVTHPAMFFFGTTLLDAMKGFSYFKRKGSKRICTLNESKSIVEYSDGVECPVFLREEDLVAEDWYGSSRTELLEE